MDIMLWITVCLFACIGVVYTATWFLSRRRPPNGVRRVYHVIPLYDAPEQMEAQLRYSMSRIRWGGTGEIVMLLDMGLGDESMAICESMICAQGLMYCREDNFCETLRRLDELQTAD